MNSLRKHVLIALIVSGFGSAAIAQTAPAPEGRHGHAATQEQRIAKWGEHFAKRQAKLHAALQLTSAQEPAWAAYQAAIKPAPMAGRGDRAGWAALSAPARMEKMIAMAKQHTAAMESKLGPLNAFYATLTPAQKKVFDENTRGGRGGHGGHHGGGHHMKGAMHG
ncbi:MAG: Spy/CpxP family protein refolding chaperone [Pseudomonadota bacterium]